MYLNYLCIFAENKNKMTKENLSIEQRPHNSFTRELFFELSVLENHTITISFIPNTESYNNYGLTIGIKVIFEDSELQELILNYSQIPIKRTTGYIKGKALLPQLTDEQIYRLKIYGFNTMDIYEIINV